MLIIKLIIMVLVGSLIGWITNFLAIKLLFRPYNPINILGFKLQGLIPKRKMEIAENIATTIDKELISIKDITSTIDSLELEEEINIIVSRIVDGRLKEELISKFPMAGMFLSDNLMNKIKEYIKKVIEENKTELVEVIISKLEKNIDMKSIIQSKIEKYSLNDLERLTLSVAKKELKHIELIGGLIGGLIGIFQFILTQLLLKG